MWFIGVEVEQEKSAPPPKKNVTLMLVCIVIQFIHDLAPRSL